MLNLRMSDAVSLHLIFIFLPYALFTVQSTVLYLPFELFASGSLYLQNKVEFELQMLLCYQDVGINFWELFQKTMFESKNVCKVKLSSKLFM